MVKYHDEVVQGSQPWHQLRCGKLTASEIHKIITPTLKVADNDDTRAHLYELLAQRVTQYVEPSYIGDAMLRGMDDEIEARLQYDKNYAPVTDVGFVTNDKWGFTIGYSPDGLVGDDGLIECKSRKQSLQMRSLIEHVSASKIDPKFMLQVQTGLLVTERKWCDLVSYCGGLWMATVRVVPDEVIQTAILAAASAFEERLILAHDKYNALLVSSARLIPTVRKIHEEMV